MLEQMLDILRSNLVKRKVDSQCMEIKDAYPSGKVVKAGSELAGIDKDLAKIVGLIGSASSRSRPPSRASRCASPARSATICRRPSHHARRSPRHALQFTNFRD